jgi:DNA-binding SARP family transcriptional activator
MGAVDYGILGSLEASRAGRQLALGGAKQRAVLGILLVGANRVVTTDELIESLWTENRPGKPQTAIQGYVSQLRKVLGPDRPFEVISTEPAGYQLRVDREHLDLFRLEALLRSGRDRLDAGRAAGAADTFSDALSLFRGPPLADFTYESWAQPHIGRLDELRLMCLEERIEADLQLGRHAELVGEIEGLVAANPLRERLRAHLMLALYRAARQSEALAAYQDARRVLVEEFGIEPTRALQEIERKILLQDPSLDLKQVAHRAAAGGGTLTLLFTDIEGSTRLLHRLGDDYAQVLLEHRRLLREALEARNGRIVDDHGDCFFATFMRAADGADAAAAAQRALAAYPWPENLPVKVRMGLHTGEPVPVGDGFVGLDVHRVARICDAAYGGQVLVSQEAADLLGDEFPDGLDIQDLGEHMLKDLTQPERLFHLVIPGLPEQFPPPRGRREMDVPHPDRSILVVPETGTAISQLVEVAEPLARSLVAHELIVAQLIDVTERTPAELDELLTGATVSLHELRDEFVERAISARVAAFTSAAVGDDIARLASEQAVDLVLMGRLPEQLGDGELDSELETVLANAPCDVAICRLGSKVDTGSDLVLVPFGGSAHDWAALELGAWIASAGGGRLRLLGVMGDPEVGKRDASRLLAAASLTVQQLVGVPSEPTLVPAGGDGLLHATTQAGLLVVGVPDDWRERGLGQVRADLARTARPTTLFVRRGVRPGGLAPRDSHTRFTWSLSDLAQRGRRELDSNASGAENRRHARRSHDR